MRATLLSCTSTARIVSSSRESSGKSRGRTVADDLYLARQRLFAVAARRRGNDVIHGIPQSAFQFVQLFYRGRTGVDPHGRDLRDGVDRRSSLDGSYVERSLRNSRYRSARETFDHPCQRDDRLATPKSLHEWPPVPFRVIS